MRCGKCGGFIYHDSLYRGETHVDFACIMCGKRWFIKKSNALVRYIFEGE